MQNPKTTPTPKPGAPYSLEADDRDADYLVQLAKGDADGIFGPRSEDAPTGKTD